MKPKLIQELQGFCQAFVMFKFQAFFSCSQMVSWIDKFEELNEGKFSVNVYVIDDDDKSISAYRTKTTKAEHHVNLIKVDEDQTSHYVLVRNYDKLIGSQTNKHHCHFHRFSGAKHSQLLATHHVLISFGLKFGQIIMKTLHLRRGIGNQAAILVFVLPHQFLPGLLKTIKGAVQPDAVAVSLVKGQSALISQCTDALNRKYEHELRVFEQLKIQKKISALIDAAVTQIPWKGNAPEVPWSIMYQSAIWISKRLEAVCFLGVFSLLPLFQAISRSTVQTDHYAQVHNSLHQSWIAPVLCWTVRTWPMTSHMNILQRSRVLKAPLRDCPHERYCNVSYYIYNYVQYIYYIIDRMITCN